MYVRSEIAQLYFREQVHLFEGWDDQVEGRVANLVLELSTSEKFGNWENIEIVHSCNHNNRKQYLETMVLDTLFSIDSEFEVVFFLLDSKQALISKISR